MKIVMSDSKILHIDAEADEWFDLAYAIDDYLMYLDREPVLGYEKNHPLMQLRDALRWVKD